LKYDIFAPGHASLVVFEGLRLSFDRYVPLPPPTIVWLAKIVQVDLVVGDREISELRRMLKIVSNEDENLQCCIDTAVSIPIGTAKQRSG